jgi:hypothetical protein
MTSSTVAYFILMCWEDRGAICVADAEAFLDRGTKENASVVRGL